MKKHYLFFVMLVALFGCDKIKDATTVDVKTDLDVDIPITSSSITAIVQEKSIQWTSESYAFQGEGIVSLNDEPDLNDYLGYIDAISLDGNSQLVIRNISSASEITQIGFSWGYCSSKEGEYAMKPEIKLSNPVYSESAKTLTFSLDGNLPELLSFLEGHPKYYYKVKLSGTSVSSITTTAKVLAPLKVEASPL